MKPNKIGWYGEPVLSIGAIIRLREMERLSINMHRFPRMSETTEDVPHTEVCSVTKNKSRV